MDNRLVAAAAVMLVVGAAGCSSQPAALGGTTAKVTINGQGTGGPHPVRCTQTGWTWTIETPNDAKGFRASVGTGDKVVVESVTFHDFGGFTGNYWKGNIGEAEVKTNQGKFTITGSADGSFSANPSNAVNATFRIEADC